MSNRKQRKLENRSLWCLSTFNQIVRARTIGSDLFKVFLSSLGASKIPYKNEPAPQNILWFLEDRAPSPMSRAFWTWIEIRRGYWSQPPLLPSHKIESRFRVTQCNSSPALDWKLHNGPNESMPAPLILLPHHIVVVWWTLPPQMI